MDIERLRWVIDFANRDLATMREGDWLNVKDELKWLLQISGSGIKIKTLVGGYVRNYSEDQIGELQNAVRLFLHRVAQNNETLGLPVQKGFKEITPPVWTLTLEFSPSLSFKSLLGARGEGVAGAGITVSATDSDHLILFAVIESLKGLHDDLRLCPECGSIFYRIRKQKYCSKKCINVATRREWLKNPENQKKESDWAHKRYEKRVKKLKGENVKVQRRTRRKKGQMK